jgi:hypothetical protein
MAHAYAAWKVGPAAQSWLSANKASLTNSRINMASHVASELHFIVDFDANTAASTLNFPSQPVFLHNQCLFHDLKHLDKPIMLALLPVQILP